MPRPNSLADWLALLESRHPVAIELGLERVARVADRLSLERPAARVITVAGTNGKGSCVALIEALALRAGLRTGTYTSPHLLAYNERIRLDGRAVTDAALCDAFARIEAVRGEVRLTYFETGTLAALLLMEAAAPDLAVLEVGMGGRLDAVNIVDPDVAVITSIDLDHQAWLGPDRNSIGVEKAGIARPGIPVICGDPQPPPAMLEVLGALGSPPLILGDPDFSQRWTENGLSLTCRAPGGGRIVHPGLPAPQLPPASAACAVQALVALDMAPAPQQVAAVFRQTGLAGRFQRLRHRDRELILDVAHNPAAALLLARRLAAEGWPRRRGHAVFGALADKDIPGLVAPLAPLVGHWHCTELPGIARAAPAARLIGVLYNLPRAGSPPAVVAAARPDPLSAFSHALETSRPGDWILVFGSFHTVAPVLGWGAAGGA
ncbi:MAG: bifunctional tetrahydrofolate synthase/dihydrofolate synthase, partial [Pseudomonadota bacterium]